MNIQQVNPFITYLSGSIIISSDIIIKNEKQKDILFTLPKSIYFYNGPDHIISCLYSQKQYNEELLPYLTNRLKKHKDIKKFNNIPLVQYINSKWKKLKQSVYLNTITTVIRFDDLNNPISMETLLELQKNKKPHLSIEERNLSKLKKEYDSIY